jgi:NAD(P)-dependent dehydrogenase (short-subunit alcohol dehydrogenase family)
MPRRGAAQSGSAQVSMGRVDSPSAVSGRPAGPGRLRAAGRASSPRIVNISSSVGSLTWQADPAVDVGPVLAAYSPTKSYLNAITVQYARQFAGTDILINAACPGLVATDFTGFFGRPVQEAAVTPIRLATLPHGGPTGSFFNDDGVVPW